LSVCLEHGGVDLVRVADRRPGPGHLAGHRLVEAVVDVRPVERDRGHPVGGDVELDHRELHARTISLAIFRMLSAVTADATLTEQVETARSWLRANWSTDITLREWWRRLADAGYAAPTWPSPYGFGAPAAVARAIHAELGAAGVIGPPS